MTTSRDKFRIFRKGTYDFKNSGCSTCLKKGLPVKGKLERLWSYYAVKSDESTEPIEGLYCSITCMRQINNYWLSR